MVKIAYQEKIARGLKLKQSVLWIVFFCTIISYNSCSAYITVNPMLCSLLLFAGVFILLLTTRKIKLDKSFVVVVLLVSSAFLTFIISDSVTNWYSYIRFVCLLLFTFLFVAKVKFATFRHYYLLLLRIIAIASLVLYMYSNIISKVLPLPTIVNSNGVVYYNAVITFVIKNATTRNCGFFWEPGVYLSFLAIGIFFVICGSEKDTKTIALFVIAMITTGSAVCIPFLILLLFLSVNSKHYPEKVSLSASKLFFNALVLALVVFTFLFVDNILESLISRYPAMFGRLSGKTSFDTRLYGPIIDLSIFSSSPLWGVGLSNYNTAWLNTKDSIFVTSQTSTPTYYLATFGISGLLYSYIWLCGLFKQKNLDILFRIGAVVLLSMILIKEPHHQDLTMYIITFYIYREMLRNNDDKSKGNELCV